MTASLRIAVVGAGPAGLYVADALLFQKDVPVEVDVFDRLPTPFGLLRYGVAPDHLKIKSLARVLQRTLDDPRLRLFGGVQLGVDVTVEELRGDYDGVVYAFGAATDRRLAIQGEGLAGSESATRFVHWYSGSPDVGVDAFRLDAREVCVVGVGNVAVDVTRILLKDVEALRRTDMPRGVLEVLAASRVTDVHVLGRRGPENATFTHKELKELGELVGVDVMVDPADLERAPAMADGDIGRNLTLLREWADRPRTNAPRRLHLHFWSRPVELLGGEAVEGVVVERTALSSDRVLIGEGAPRVLPVQLVLRSVGYRGVPLEGVPFDPSTCTVPVRDGRVLREGFTRPGEYGVGWISRGPVGVLGTNRADAEAVVASILADAPALLAEQRPDGQILELLSHRGVTVVDCDGWSAIDAAEVARGARDQRPREKICTRPELYAAALT